MVTSSFCGLGKVGTLWGFGGADDLHWRLFFTRIAAVFPIAFLSLFPKFRTGVAIKSMTAIQKSSQWSMVVEIFIHWHIEHSATQTHIDATVMVDAVGYRSTQHFNPHSWCLLKLHSSCSVQQIFSKYS